MSDITNLSLNKDAELFLEHCTPCEKSGTESECQKMVTFSTGDISCQTALNLREQMKDSTTLAGSNHNHTHWIYG